MTREELIRYGKDYLNDLENAYCEISDKHMEFVRQSIKALSAEPCCNCIEFKRYAKEMGFEIEQEPVLDKIRAEIKEESRFCPLTEGLERALEIIEKYTAEKE